MPAVYTRDSLARLITDRMRQYGNQCDLNCIDVSRVTDLSRVFASTPELRQFNGDISKWDTSKALSMKGLFEGSQFNGDISQWNTSACTNMSETFKGSAFDGNISRWDVSRVRHFHGTFSQGAFGDTQPEDALSAWDVGRAIVMTSMFEGSSFDGDLSSWNPQQATSMAAMFKNADFRHDIAMWSLENQPKLDTANMFKGNPQGLAAQSITPWVLDMLLKENLPFSDQKWRLATKRYEMLNKGLGLDPTTRYADIAAIHSALVSPNEVLPIEHLNLGML